MTLQPSKVTQLLDRLLDKTRSGDVRWKEGITWDSFQADFPDQSVIIYKQSEGTDQLSKGKPPFSLQVIDNHGRVVALLPTMESRDRVPTLAEEIDKLRDLFEEARRSSSPAEKAIDALLAELS
jgi:hypothetical protein